MLKGSEGQMNNSSILVMLFGQSNADAHNAGPSLPAAFLDNPRCVVPNDGRTFQGWRGRPAKKPITGFVPSYNPASKIQSIGAAIGCSLLDRIDDPSLEQVIVRSAARGGCPLRARPKHGRIIEGIHRDILGNHSPIFTGFIDDVRAIRDAAEANGAPVRHLYIPFFHGEADRSADADTYRAQLEQMMDEADAAFAEMGLETDWLLAQASGTAEGSNGNAWASRTSLAGIANDRANAHLAVTNYAYKLEDSVHLTAESKVLVGELLARRIADLETGRDRRLTRLTHMVINGNEVDLMFDSPTGITIDDTRFPTPDTFLGFSVTGQKGQDIVAIKQTGPATIRLICALPLGGHKTRINYAYQRNIGTADHVPEHPYPIGRGCLREDWSAPSKILDGEELLSWVPAFSIPVPQDLPVEREVALAA
jgi:hypothetical protein